MPPAVSNNIFKLIRIYNIYIKKFALSKHSGEKQGVTRYDFCQIWRSEFSHPKPLLRRTRKYLPKYSQYRYIKLSEI